MLSVGRLFVLRNILKDTTKISKNVYKLDEK